MDPLPTPVRRPYPTSVLLFVRPKKNAYPGARKLAPCPLRREAMSPRPFKETEIMDIKEIGSRHGAAMRATLEAARHRAQGAIGSCVQQVKQLTGYAAGFAQGLLRPNA